MKKSMKYIFISYSGLSYPIANKLQKEGCEVIVGRIDDIKDYFLEIVRDKAKDFVLTHYSKQLHVPEVKKFSKVEDGIDFLKHSKDIWVLKPNKDGVKTFVPDVNDPDLAKKQIVEILRNFP